MFVFKKLYLVGSTSIGQKSGPPVNRVFRCSISRITTFWAQIWNRSDLLYILTTPGCGMSICLESYDQICCIFRYTV